MNEVSECLYKAVRESSLASSVMGGHHEKLPSRRKQAHKT